MSSADKNGSHGKSVPEEEASGLDSGESQSGDERRHYPRTERSLRVSFTFEGEEFRAQTVDVSKSGALFASTVAPSMGTELLLLLQDTRDPKLRVHLKSEVVRHGAARGRRKEFAVQFGDAVSKDPTTLGRFLNQVLNIANGLIRVMEGDSTERVFAFSFDPIHREGAERIKALQSSLFGSLEEMEEADSILESFGKVRPELSQSQKDDLERETVKADRERKRSQGSDKGDKLTLGLDVLLESEAVGSKAEELSMDDLPEPDEKRVSEAAAAFRRATESAPESSEGAPVSASDADAQEAPRPSRKRGFLSRLLSGGVSKGDEVIVPERAPMMVARETQLNVTVKQGSNSQPARAVRLYCAGMKCETDGELPPLYVTVMVEVRVPGRRRKTVELWGDITRVRPRDSGEAGGVFEVRFSMRTAKGDMESYRKMLDVLVRQDGKELHPEG